MIEKRIRKQWMKDGRKLYQDLMQQDSYVGTHGMEEDEFVRRYVASMRGVVLDFREEIEKARGAIK